MTEDAVPLVDVEGLTFRYRRATEPAIADVSLTVHPGEVAARGRPVGLRQEHAHPRDQRAASPMRTRAS